MSEKISEYTTSVTALASGDLMDVSKLISTSPDVYQSQKLNYSVLLTELNADLGFIDGSGTTNTLSKFTSSGTIGDSTIIDNGVNYLLSLLSTNGFVKTTGGTGQLSISSQVSATEGGTGRGSWTAGSLPYISATNTFSEVLVGTNGHFLSLVGGVPTWAAVSASNLGSANLTISSATRWLKLNGNTSGDSFDIQNNSGSSLLTLNGNGDSRQTVIGTGIKDVFHGANVFSREYGNANYRRFYSTSGAHVLTVNPDTNYYECVTANSGITAPKFVLRGDSSSGSWFVMNNNVGNVSVKHYPASYHYFDTSLRVGGTDAADSAQFLSHGKGSTSATITALFQNSSSVAALKVKDDGYCILKANNAAIASGDLANNEMSFYIDEGTNHCVVKVKYSSGTVKTGTFNLT